MARYEVNIDGGLNFNWPVVESVWPEGPLADGVKGGLIEHRGTTHDLE